MMKAAALLLLPSLTVAFMPSSSYHNIQQQPQLAKKSSLTSTVTNGEITTQDNNLFIDMSTDKTATQQSVSKYYGETLQQTSDLKTNACCTAASPFPHIKDAIKNIHPDVIAKYYGECTSFPTLTMLYMVKSYLCTDTDNEPIAYFLYNKQTNKQTNKHKDVASVCQMK